ncbi:uncharacterized protein N7458_003148 [Penicillium daleae]|uniref:Nucleoside phosphorylase domain-containing protein n=1 Tax=Penicillium daleae TaxID=63821 RepID=A0AAD6CE43_9EURO|nr:uncharacterized protein N7458_003148 [Penicillium daleae]KAJ5461596.1 hypothetical protein N7458_003148 [Penicillium daleae]
MYPSILALGVILIEIATKQLFRYERLDYLWDETTINDYYEWAWTIANCSNLGNMIRAAYEVVVNNCLDAELFKDGLIDPSKFDEDLEIRQSRLYEKVEVSKPEIPISQNPPQTEQTRLVSRSRFTIAIFCALPLEADAVSEVFEKILDEEVKDYHKAPGDDNIYTLGKLLHHNVVLVYMAGMGKGAASQAASTIRSSYPEIKLALVVGICGGVPLYVAGEEDLVLGDVVISNGIVQYDFGRRFLDTFLSKARPEIAGPKLRGLLAKLKGLGCQKGSLVPRKRLQEASANGCPLSPKIHFGLFGSGDIVMKSGQHRDKTATTHDLIAFEMEASGVWDILPCLVIKGVCDYADSHKNKNWQHYAAATAASCMKAVLEECAIGDW